MSPRNPGLRVPSPHDSADVARGDSFPESDGATSVWILCDGTLRLAPGLTSDEIIAAIAAQQRERVARWQLLAGGVDRGTIGRRLHRGRLLLKYPSVYALPGTDEVPHAADAAGLLSAGPEALLADHSAAVLYRLRPGIAYPVHVVIPRDRRGVGTTPGLIVHRSKILTPRDRRIHEGLPVTSPARMFLDISVRLPDREVERLLADAIYSLKLLDINEINELLGRAGGHPGAPRLARVAGHPPAKTDSKPETDLLDLIRQATLEEPLTQYWILDYKVDFYWPAHKLVVEVDAYGTHGSRAKFEADRRRDAHLTAAGYTVIRFTREQIENEPFAVIALLARMLSAGFALPE